MVDAELHGYTPDEVKVTLDQGVLHTCAEHKEEHKPRQEDGRDYLQERRYRRIERSFTPPVAVDEDKVNAKLKDGVLHLSLKKRKGNQPLDICVKQA